MEGSEVEEQAMDLSFLGARAPFEGIKLQAFSLFFFLHIRVHFRVFGPKLETL